MYVMEYCCIIVMHVFALRFKQYRIIPLSRLLTMQLVVFFKIGVNAAKIAKILGSICNKLMKILR